MTETPAPMQPAPSSSGDGARRNPGHVYQCEVCGEPVPMTHAEYDNLVVARARRFTSLARRAEWMRRGARVRCEAHELPPRKPHASKVRAPNVYAPRSLPRIGSRFNLNHDERMDYGATVTARDEEGHLLTVVGVGPVTKALGDICSHLDNLNEEGGEWRIVSISTPATVYADLQGARDEMTSSPEIRLLAMVHRSDLLYRPPRGFQGE